MPQKRVKYVCIPSDNSEPIHEKELVCEEEVECESLLNELKDYFTARGSFDTEEAKRAKRRALIEQIGESAAAQLDAGVLDAATNMQMVENIALLQNNKETGFIAVNMYCDDSAQAKQLPLNERAANLAQCAGKFMQVRGDVFLGRIFDNEDDFKRLDFTLNEVSSTAAWVRQAEIQNQKTVQRGDKAGQWLQDMQGHKAARPEVRELSPAEVEKEEGNVEFKKGNYEEAAVRYGAALDIDPTLTVARNNRAMAFIKLGEFAAAYADASGVLQVEPENVKAMLRRATALEALARMEEAVADLQAALRLQPTNKEAAERLAKLQMPAQ